MNQTPTAGIILAAGMSKRFGKLKQLANLSSQVLIDQVVETALNSNLDRVVLVLGHEAHKIMDALRHNRNHPRLHLVVNEHYRRGMAESLGTGLRCVMKQFPSIMVLLGDMPLIGPKMIDLLLDCFEQADCDICAPVHEGHRGHPVIFSRKFYSEILALKGDIGARDIIRLHSDRIHWVKTDDDSVLIDIDQPADLQEVFQRYSIGIS